MRRFGGIFIALALGASTLAGCGSQGSGALGPIDVDAKSIEAQVTKLAGETFKGTTTTAADLETVKKLLPAELAMSWGALTFDAATNSTLVTDLKLTPKDMPSVGVSVAELRLWDFDAKLLEDRIAGKRLTETAKLASRIDAKNISVFGLAEAINTSAAGAAPVAPTEDATPLKFQPTDPTAPAEIQPEPTDPFGGMDGMSMYSAPNVSRMDISLGRMIIDDLVLRPYQVVPAPAAAATADPYDSMATMMPMLQQMVSVAQSYGIDTAAYFDYKIGFDVTEAGEKVSGDITIKSMGARGMRGGDLDGMYIRDIDYGLVTPAGAAPLDFKYKMGLMTLKNLRLEKVLSYIVKGAAPPRTETNLLGLGIWHTENESLALGGQDIYTAGETTFDGSGFYWFIPTKLQATGKNISLNLGAIMDVASKFADLTPASTDPLAPPADNAATLAEIQQVKAMIEKNGLSKLTFDSNFGWNWNAQNGETKLDFGLLSKDLLDVTAKYEGGFPSFKAVSDAIPETGEPNEMAIASAFQSNSSLKLIDLNIKDNGGLTKIFGMMGDLAPSQGAPQAMTAAEVRSQAVEGVKMMARPDVSGIPELGPLLAPVADFLSTGGKLRIAVQPGKPMPFGTLAGTLMSAGMGSPAQAIKDLGLKVEHSK